MKNNKKPGRKKWKLLTAWKFKTQYLKKDQNQSLKTKSMERNIYNI